MSVHAVPGRSDVGCCGAMRWQYGGICGGICHTPYRQALVEVGYCVESSNPTHQTNLTASTVLHLLCIDTYKHLQTRHIMAQSMLNSKVVSIVQTSTDISTPGPFLAAGVTAGATTSLTSPASIEVSGTHPSSPRSAQQAYCNSLCTMACWKLLLQEANL